MIRIRKGQLGNFEIVIKAIPNLPIPKFQNTSMKQFLSFVKKEFHHILRDRRTMFILLGMPIVQIIIFGFALTNEVKNAKIAVLDPSKDAATVSLTGELNASKYFDVEENVVSYDQIESAFKKGRIKLAVVYPQHFGEDLEHLNQSAVQLIADA